MAEGLCYLVRSFYVRPEPLNGRPRQTFFLHFPNEEVVVTHAETGFGICSKRDEPQYFARQLRDCEYWTAGGDSVKRPFEYDSAAVASVIAAARDRPVVGLDDVAYAAFLQLVRPIEASFSVRPIQA